MTPLHLQRESPPPPMITFELLLPLLLVTPLARSLRLATYNIRYDSKPDNVTVAESLHNLPNALAQPTYLGLSKEQPWSVRRLRLAEQVLSRDPSVIGLQEVLIRQVKDIAELLGKDWQWVN